MNFLDVLDIVFIALGFLFMVITVLGLLRLPDFFARVHAVSKSETLGIALVLLGLIIHEGATLVSLKLALILVFVAIANPVGVHLLTRAALRTGQMPWRRGGGG